MSQHTSQHNPQRKNHILIVDDDPLNRRLIACYFEKESDYLVSQTDNAQRALILVKQNDIDVMLLDIKMPGLDGYELTRQLRRFSDVGIILVSVKNEDIDKIIGLELGADDYITKPFNERELFSRTRSLIRRRNGALLPDNNAPMDTPAEHDTHTFGNWSFNFDKRQLRDQSGEAVELSEVEYKLLHTFILSRGRVLSRDSLMNGIYKRDWHPQDRSIDILVSRLRKKLKDEDAHNGVIKTIHGTGYQLTM